MLALLWLAGCGGGGGSAATGSSTSSGTTSTGSASSGTATGSTSSAPSVLAAAAGKALFFDTSLSASGKQSCGTCHVPSRAYTSDPATDSNLPVPLGGPHMDQTGLRNVPSLMYASFTPAFSSKGGTTTGGFFRDGRASSLATQAQQPFLTAFEMANADAAELVGRLQQSAASLQAFVAAYGEGALGDPQTALADMGLALAAYETDDASFHPFSSKYDYWLEGKATLTTQEQNGLALFNNPGKGNCTACHPSQVQSYSQHALFTDFTYDNIGVPRNWSIPANTPGAVSPVSGAALVAIAAVDVPADAEYAFYDLGLCGPFAPLGTDVNARPVLSATTSLCGQFKVPTLRNVAQTAPYFHNGVFANLHQVIEWYVTRDINNDTLNNPDPVAAGVGGNPYVAGGSFYTQADGTSDLYEYNDLPAAYDANVNIGEVPYTPPTFAGGQAPTLNATEIDEVVAFLCTLTDGYDPTNPTAYSVPAQCQPTAGAN